MSISINIKLTILASMSFLSPQFQEAIASGNHPANDITAIATEYIYRNLKKYVLQYKMVINTGERTNIVESVRTIQALPIINIGPEINTYKKDNKGRYFETTFSLAKYAKITIAASGI